jgi:hypothetical protein
MVDWTKPLQCKNFNPNRVYFIGFTPDGDYAVIQTQGETLYKVDVKTEYLLGYTTAYQYKVTNCKTPEQEAWESFSNNSDYYLHPFSPEKLFKAGFHYGANHKPV